MVITRFPPIESADEHGLLAVGGDLDPESILLAYRQGIFPWPVDDQTLAWFAPPERAVIFLKDLHVSRSLKRALRKQNFIHHRDRDFSSVINLCAEVVNRGEQDGTWITPNMIAAYQQLFDLGYCHSFESYIDDSLVGGLYGIQIGKFFAAESSFFRVANASKAAMCFMVEYLKECGIEWFDCQVLTPLSEGFGARVISREEYMELLGAV